MIVVKNQFKISLIHYFFVLALILFGCKKKTNAPHPPHESAEVISISLQNSPEWAFNDYFEIKKVIPLDSKIIISELNKLVFHNEKILLLDQKSKSIVRFSNDGDFEKRLHFVGKGPEEYMEITDFIVDNKSNDIIILDGNIGQQMVRYDWEGNFKKKQQIPFHSNSLEALEDGFIIYCGNHQSKENVIDDKSFNNIVYCDSNFHVYDKQIPVSSAWNGLRYLFKNSTAFAKYGESTYCQVPMPNNNTIYKLTNGTLHPRYQFDFGYNISRVLGEGKSTKDILTQIEKYEIPHNLNSYFENNQIIYFAVLKGDKVQQIIYNKDKKEAFNRSISLDKLDKHFFPMEYHGDGTFLVHVLFPYLIYESELESYIPKEIRNKSKSEDNPILLLFDVKRQILD